MTTMQFPSGGVMNPIEKTQEFDVSTERKQAVVDGIESWREWAEGMLSTNAQRPFISAFRPNFRQASSAEIHADVDKEAERQLRFAERVLEYRQMYPGNAFLTIEQVKAICKRYDLVFAPEFMFAGEIPERNRAEISAFKLHEKHVKMREELYILAVDHMQHTGRSLHICESVVPDDIHAPWAMNLGSNFGLYSPKGFVAIRQWAQHTLIQYNRPLQDILDAVIPVARTKKGWIKLEIRDVHVMDMNITREDISFGAGINRSETVAKLDFSLPTEMFWETCSYQEDVFKVVICPVSMLHQSIPFQVSQEGEVVLSRSMFRENGFGYDPIVLQPVDEGFLVVTKWDAEANLPEVAGQTN